MSITLFSSTRGLDKRVNHTGRISVRSIEDFVSQNLDELFALSDGDLISGFRRLLEVYNERVDRVETDKSLLIEIPRNLLD